MSNRKAFTLIEVIITVTIIAFLAMAVIMAINPGEHLARGRDTQRKSNLVTILNSIGQRIVDNKGIFETGCAAGAIPNVPTKMAVGVGNYDIAPCLVSDYLPDMPFDPKATGAGWTSTVDYDTGYNISQDAVTGRITLEAPSAELETISYVR